MSGWPNSVWAMLCVRDVSIFVLAEVWLVFPRVCVVPLAAVSNLKVLYSLVFCMLYIIPASLAESGVQWERWLLIVALLVMFPGRGHGNSSYFFFRVQYYLIVWKMFSCCIVKAVCWEPVLPQFQSSLVGVYSIHVILSNGGLLRRTV